MGAVPALCLPLISRTHSHTVVACLQHRSARVLQACPSLFNEEVHDDQNQHVFLSHIF